MASAVPELPVLARDQAFENLYRSYVGDVYRYALALLRNPADAEDVTQTTFMNAYRAIQRGDEIRKPHNWLIKIAHNTARSRFAHAGRRAKEVPLEDHVEQLAMPESEQPSMDEVLQALARLPFNQRAALVMRELEGRTYVEIAETLDVSVPAVETLIFRARRALRLRASSLRVLTGVPVPTSLAHLVFDGGAAVGGGGALAGAGLLAKAAVAIVAGVVATGIGGDRTRPAVAGPKAPQGGTQPVSTVRAAHASGGHAATATRSGGAGGQEKSPTPTKGVTGPNAKPVVAGSTATGTPTARAIEGQPSAAPTAKASHPVGEVVSTVEQTVNTATETAQTVVQQTVDTVESVAGAVGVPVTVPPVPPVPPIQVPLPPPPPVQLPDLPKPPKLP
jgi:RNA polymerase sigma factor (sigma-70 family)